jgi:hypothetical protein
MTKHAEKRPAKELAKRIRKLTKVIYEEVRAAASFPGAMERLSSMIEHGPEWIDRLSGLVQSLIDILSS